MSWFSSPVLSLGVNEFFLIPSLSKMGISSSLLPPGHFCHVSGATVWGQAVTVEDKLCSAKLASLNVPGLVHWQLLVGLLVLENWYVEGPNIHFAGDDTVGWRHRPWFYVPWANLPVFGPSLLCPGPSG